MTPRSLALVLTVLLASGGGGSHLMPTTRLPAAAEEPFVPLFDGQSLAGWHGAVENYVVEEGLLRCRPQKGGNIYTDEEFADFELQFEFRLTAGGNNGIGLRVPDGGHASTQGLEIQILDDAAEKYAQLKPYQYHGSVYGLVPARRGFLRPVGEWNSQTIRYVGSHITIVLNGETIVDADLSEWSDQEGPDGKLHPGVSRTSGHLCLCTHGSQVDFRNLRIRRIAAVAADQPGTPP
jgi:hypothetical protein